MRIFLKELGDPIAVEISTVQLNELRSASASWRSRLNLGTDPLVFGTAGTLTTIQAKGVTGAFRAGDLEVEIAPKFLSVSSLNNWRAALLNVLAVTGNLINEIEAASLAVTDAHSIADLFTFVIVEALDRCAGAGLPRGYLETSARLPFLRGRIDYMDPLSFLFVGTIPCRFDVLSEDTAVSRLIKWALSELASTVHSTSLLARVQEWLSQMHEISNATKDSLRQGPMHLPLQHQLLEPAVKVSELLLQGRGLMHEAGAEEAPGFLWNSNSVFESFLDHMVKSICNSSGRYAFSDKPITLAFPAPSFSLPGHFDSNKSTLQAKPDHRILLQGDTVLVLDSKYKNWKREQPEPEDTYQIMAAGRACRCANAVLIYPSPSSGMRRPTSWDVCGAGSPVRISAVFVDINAMSETFGYRRVVSQLATDLAPLIGDATK